MDKKNFIIFSTADWDNPFWTNKQHIASRLAKRGHKVLYIESLGLRAPTIKVQDLYRILKRLLSFFKGKRKVQDNLWVYSPIIIPLHRFNIIRKLNHILLVTILKFFKWQLKFDRPIFWTYNPTVLDLMQALAPEKMVYHSVDDLSASPGIDKDLILASEEELLKKMDAIFCTSQKIYQHCQKIAGDKAHYHSNVVDYKHFVQAREPQEIPLDLKNISSPRIGFVGAVSEYKLDIPLLIETAIQKPDWQFVIIGKIGEGQPGTKIEKIKQISNIHLIGPKDYRELPKFLHHFDVCTIPAPLNDYTNAMFPMKFYEYMAAGKPIVASNIDSLAELNDTFYTYVSQKEFTNAISNALDKGIPNPSICDRLSQENTWDKRLDKMLELIKI